jgi:hypothetical protein
LSLLWLKNKNIVRLANTFATLRENKKATKQGIEDKSFKRIKSNPLLFFTFVKLKIYKIFCLFCG